MPPRSEQRQLSASALPLRTTRLVVRHSLLALILNLVGAWILLAIVHVALGHFDDVSGVGEQLITYGMVFLFSIYAVALVLVSFRKLFVPIMVIYPGGIWDQMIGYVAWEAMQPCGPSVTRSIRPVAHFIPPFIPFWLSHVSAHFEFQVSQETADNVRRMRLGRLLGGGAGVSGRDNCCDLNDHIPSRSYALFQARSALRALFEGERV